MPSGLAASVESGIGGFCGGSTTVCGRCSLRADLTCFLDGLLASFFDGFSGAITGVASGESSADNPRPLGSFSDSTQRKKASLSSSIAAHPARPKPADTAIRMSAARAQARIDTLVIRRVSQWSRDCASLRATFEDRRPPARTQRAPSLLRRPWQCSVGHRGRIRGWHGMVTARLNPAGTDGPGSAGAARADPRRARRHQMTVRWAMWPLPGSKRTSASDSRTNARFMSKRFRSQQKPAAP